MPVGERYKTTLVQYSTVCTLTAPEISLGKEYSAICSDCSVQYLLGASARIFSANARGCTPSWQPLSAS